MKTRRVLIIADWPLFRKGIQDALAASCPEARYLHAATVAEVESLVPRLSDVAVTVLDAECLAFQQHYRRVVCRGYPTVVVGRQYGSSSLVSSIDKPGSDSLAQRVANRLLAVLGASDNVVHDPAHFWALKQPRYGKGPAQDLLSRVERNVTEALCAGLSNQEIARELNISIHTVKSHLGRVFRKLGVSTRTQLVLSHRR